MPTARARTAGAVAATALLLAVGAGSTAGAAAESAPAGAPQPCTARLTGAPLDDQLDCLDRLRQAGSPASFDLDRVIELLGASDGATDPRLVAGALDVLRAAGADGEPAAETLSGLLSYRSPLYQDRDKMLVIRLRAYLLVTLAEIGFPRSAASALIDTLAHVDERMPVLELAAAARAVRALGADGRAFIPHLLEALAVRSGAQEISLERYEPDFPAGEATTVQLEAVRSLGRVASVDDAEVADLLRQLAADTSGELDPRLVEEAGLALARLTGAAPAADRARRASLDIGYTDHDGNTGVLADLLDRPALLTFFYTRCQNSKKCPMTVARLAALQRQLDAAGLADRVRLLAITYEPQFDTPERLARQATARGLELGDGARALQLDGERQGELLDQLDIQVSYNAGWVNAHGVELSLLDAGGRLVGKYDTQSWQNPRVVEDVERLLRVR